MKRGATGQSILISTVGGEKCKAFIPNSLPPKSAIKIDSNLQNLMEKALLALGRLDSVTTLLPDTSLFLYMFIRKEAILSSQIEGTQSSLSDLLLYESEEVPGVPLDDVREVARYTSAMQLGLARIREGFPLSLRLIKEVHHELLVAGRGSEKNPGEFRKSQNWIGGDRPGNAVYVPPPPNEIMTLMGAFENYLHDNREKAPVLIKAALSHAQFETIHPFLDGNGRLGRLLITLILCNEGVLGQPILYLSLYLKSHRQEYYNLLQEIRFEGDWEKWLAFFLTGIIETANQAVATAKTLADLFESDRQKIEPLGRVSGSILRIHRVFQQSPLLTVPKIVKETGISYPTVQSAVYRLIELGILVEIPKKRRAKLFSYHEYIRILSEGTEPI